MARAIKRTKKGRFAKGTRPGPGKRARKDSPVPSSKEIRDAFYQAFVEIFVKGGSINELVEFCKRNQLNQRLLIQEVRKILPDLSTERDGAGIGTLQVVSAVPRSTDADAVMKRKIRELEAQVKDQAEELRRFKAVTTVEALVELKHEPVRPAGLPEHKPSDKDVGDLTDEELEAEIQSVQKEIEK